MKLEQNQYAQIAHLSKADFVEPEYYDYFKCVGVGCSPKTAIDQIKALLTEPEGIVDDKHFIFTIDDVWNQFSSVAKKVVMDHEFGHIAAGQLDTDRMQDGEGAIVITEWEYAADDFSVKQNGKEAVLQGLLDSIKVINKHPNYAEQDINLLEDNVIRSRLERLGYKG